MAKHDLQERLINGFSPLGYELTASDDMGMNNEFRKAGVALRFIVKPAEGGIVLLSTENPDHSLLAPTLYTLTKNLPTDVEYRTFCGSPSEFWEAVKSITEGQEP